jgi:signal transduction histidine kinase
MNETLYDSRLFAELYDVQPQAITWFQPVWSDDGRTIIDFAFVYSNDEGLKYMNLTREQFQGLAISITPTLTSHLRDVILKEMVHVYQTEEKSETTIYNPILNKYARVLRTKLRNGVLSVIQDITEETRIIKQLEKQTGELRAQKSLLDNILENSSNGISVSKMLRDENGKVVDAVTILANDAAVNHIGLPKDVYLTKRATELEPGIIGSPYYQMCIKTLETGQPFLTQYQMESNRRWLELTVSKMDADHLIHVFTDITPVKEAQLQLEKAAEQIQAVFNASTAGMFIFSPVRDESGEIIDFRFVITNPAFAAYVGQTPEVLKGQLGSTFFPGYLRNGVFDMYKRTYLTGETLRQDVHYNVDEHDLYLDLLSTKIHDEVLVTFTDYTTIKKTQFQLEKLIEDLRQSNTKLEEFAHAASHDLKEPIRKIRVFSDRLKSSLGERMDEVEHNMFDRMQNATERMTLLVDDLLSYSHISLTPVEMEDVDLNKKIQLVLADLEIPIEEKKAVVFVEELPTVKGYRRQLQQLFQNLVSNALKYSKPDVRPEITIKSSLVKGTDVALHLPAELREVPCYYLIEIVDNGIGFAQENAEKIFLMFQRLHGRSEYSGTGIGLSIARKVVDNHHGVIWAESEPGKGASFKVLLPAQIR